MSGHTPGPWTARPNGYREWKFDGGYNGVIEAEDGSTIYAGPASFKALRGNSPENAAANAALIASAPDLLAERDRLREINGELVAALEAAVSYLEDDSRSERRRQACLSGFRAALARAREG